MRNYTDNQLDNLAIVAGATRQSNHIRPDLPRFTFRMSDLHKLVRMVLADHSEEPRAMVAQQPAPQPLTADDLHEPKNGQQWRVVWWNESCRMMLPVGLKVDRYKGYRNGTMQFTLKRAHGIKEQS